MASTHKSHSLSHYFVFSAVSVQHVSQTRPTGRLTFNDGIVTSSPRIRFIGCHSTHWVTPRNRIRRATLATPTVLRLHGDGPLLLHVDVRLAKDQNLTPRQSRSALRALPPRRPLRGPHAWCAREHSRERVVCRRGRGALASLSKTNSTSRAGPAPCCAVTLAGAREAPYTTTRSSSMGAACERNAACPISTG